MPTQCLQNPGWLWAGAGMKKIDAQGEEEEGVDNPKAICLGLGARDKLLLQIFLNQPDRNSL